MKKIINLHVHSHYSLQDGLCTPEEIISKIIDQGNNSVAITDHGNMNNYGFFYKHSLRKNIKPIFGCEFYSVDSLEKWNKMKEEKKDPKELKKRNHILLLVKNDIGFKNINNLVYESYKNFYYRPRIDFKLIEKYHEGLICSTACLAGEIQQYIINDDLKKAYNLSNIYRELFKEDFYFEIQFNELVEQKKANYYIYKIAKKINCKVILTGDSHYLNLEDQKIHQTLLLLNGKKTYKDLDDKKKNINLETSGSVWEFETKELFLKNYDEYNDSRKRFNLEFSQKDFDCFCENTLEIENKVEKINIDCNIKLKDVIPDINDKHLYLKKICYESLKDKKLDDKYKERLDFELDIIKQKNLESYFLMVKKIVDDAKKIMWIGAARGSSAGGLINYLLGITQLDPIRFGLLFERFISLERIDIPDIDIDFEDNNAVKNKILSEYGKNAACISTYNTFNYSGLLKDLARVYNLKSPEYMNILNKNIVKEVNEYLDELSDEEKNDEKIDFNFLNTHSDSFIHFLKENKEIKNDLKILLGKIRNVGRHAAGIVICDNLIDKQPIMYINGVNQTSLVEGKEKISGEFGFVKIDILGLTTLKILHDCIRMIRKNYSLIHPDKIDLEDKNIYNFVFKKRNLLGIFQFETDNIRPMIEKTKPDCFEDLIAMNALFRPGPLKSGMAFEYGDRKKGLKEISYFNNSIVKKILSPTFGIIIFQEQVMKLGHELGNLSLSETSELRKYLTKISIIKNDPKSAERLECLRKIFFVGAKKNGMIEGEVDLLWHNMSAFAGYGFNRCLTGDTILLRGNGNQYCNKEVTIKYLYEEQFKETWMGDKIRSVGFPRIQSVMENNRVKLNKIIKIYENGISDIYELRTKGGKKIKATFNHKFMMGDGNYKKIIDMKVDDKIFVYDDEFENKSKRFSDQKWNKNISKGLFGFQKGKLNAAYVDGKSVYLLNAKKEVLKRSDNKCEICGKKKNNERFEFHHYFNGNYKKYHNKKNIIYLCNRCHKKEDYNLKNRIKVWKKGKKIKIDIIKSICFIGKEMTYDVEMQGPFHNFIANGFVSHNSHSVGYAVIAYQCAFLKTYYSIEFYCSLLNNEDFDNYYKIIFEARRNGIEVNEININKSQINFSIIDGKIYYGFSKIKGIGIKAAEVISDSLKKNKCNSFVDFLNNKNIYWRICNKKIINILIKIGVFDFDNKFSNRDSLLKVYDFFQDKKNSFSKEERKISDSGILFLKAYDKVKNMFKKKEIEIIKYSDEDKMKIEYEFYGANLKYSPFFINDREDKIKKLKLSGKAGGFDSECGWIIVFFTNIFIRKDRKNNDMVFLDCIDEFGNKKSGLIFSSNYINEVHVNKVYCIRGEIKDKILINEYKDIDKLFNSDNLDSVENDIINCNKCERLRNVTKFPMPHIIYCNEEDVKLMIIGRNPGLEDDYSDIDKNSFFSIYRKRWWNCNLGKYLKKNLGDNFIKKCVFFTNVCKCSSPSNKELFDDEKNNCLIYLKRQIKIINPKVIITLGKDAREMLDKCFYKGEVHNMYHPSYFSFSNDVLNDLKQTKKIMKIAKRLL